MDKVKHPRIEVKTLPNGYSLEFDGMKKQNGFMYFNQEQLLEGFMIHIGLEMTDELNTDLIKDFLIAACNWNENKKCIKEIERLSTELRAQKRKNQKLTKDIKKLKSLSKPAKKETDDDNGNDEEEDDS